jgi:hypothetical protein
MTARQRQQEIRRGGLSGRVLRIPQLVRQCILLIMLHDVIALSSRTPLSPKFPNPLVLPPPRPEGVSTPGRTRADPSTRSQERSPPVSPAPPLNQAVGCRPPPVPQFLTCLTSPMPMKVGRGIGWGAGVGHTRDLSSYRRATASCERSELT